MSKELIQRLIDKGFITTDDIMEAERGMVTDDSKQMLETLHLKYCELDHDTGECNWYDEDQQVEAWEMRSHQHWLREFQLFLLQANPPKLVPGEQDD